MTKLLFVCLGNICRSPTAEGVMAALVKRAGKSKEIHCDSAGTGGCMRANTLMPGCTTTPAAGVTS